MEDGSGARIGVADGLEIGVLHSHHAKGRENEQRNKVTLVMQNAKKGFLLAAEIGDGQKNGA